MLETLLSIDTNKQFRSTKRWSDDTEAPKLVWLCDLNFSNRNNWTYIWLYVRMIGASIQMFLNKTISRPSLKVGPVKRREDRRLWLWFAIKTLVDNLIMVNFHYWDNCEYKHQWHENLSNSKTYSHIDFLIFFDCHKMSLHVFCDTKIFLNKTYKEKWVCFRANLRFSSIFEWL